MKRLLFSMSVVVAFSLGCTGAMKGDDDEDKAEDKDKDEEKDKQVIVVPVDGDPQKEYWCCKYQEAAEDDGEEGDDEDKDKDKEGEDAPKTYAWALVEGPSECQSLYGSQHGEYVQGNECIPCCCKSPNDPDDNSQGYTFELTTPTSCALSGECVASDSSECKGAPTRTTPRPRPHTTPTRTHFGGDAPSPAPPVVPAPAEGKSGKGKAGKNN